MCVISNIFTNVLMLQIPRHIFPTNRFWIVSYFSTKAHVVVPRWGTSDEYPWHMLLWRNQNDIYLSSRAMLMSIPVTFFFFFSETYKYSKQAQGWTQTHIWDAASWADRTWKFKISTCTETCRARKDTEGTARCKLFLVLSCFTGM